LLIDYWVASQVGRFWWRLSGGRGWSRGRGPDACWAVARGGNALPAGDVAAAQEFAARMWCVALGAWLVVILAVAFVAFPLPRGGWRDGLAHALLVPTFLGAISGAQMGMISFRRNQTTRYVLRGGSQAASRPSRARHGLPRRSDFWVMLVIAVAGAALLYYARTHS
jgi:hypothetical protein